MSDDNHTNDDAAKVHPLGPDNNGAPWSEVVEFICAAGADAIPRIGDIKELSRILGLDLFLRLIEEFGGAELFFAVNPKILRKKLPFVSEEQAKTLSSAFGKTTLSIPSATYLKVEYGKHKAHKLRMEGKSVAEIARTFGLTTRAIRMRLASFGSSQKIVREPKYKRLAEQAYRLSQEGLSVNAIMSRLECGRETALAALEWHVAITPGTEMPKSSTKDPRRMRMIGNIRALSFDGKTDEQIAERLKIPSNEVREIIDGF